MQMINILACQCAKIGFLNRYQNIVSSCISVSINLVLLQRSIIVLSIPPPCATMLNKLSSEQFIDISNRVLASGVPNYCGLRMWVTFCFNTVVLGDFLVDYWDKHLIQYLAYGFPLSLQVAMFICTIAPITAWQLDILTMSMLIYLKK